MFETVDLKAVFRYVYEYLHTKCHMATSTGSLLTVISEQSPVYLVLTWSAYLAPA
jgi:hypothetical protein